MTPEAARKDLVVLAADKNAQHAVRGLLARPQALGIRRIEGDWYTHPEKDPGVLHRAHVFLRPFTKSHAHALVILDRSGSGQEQHDRATLESQIEQSMQGAGWDDRAAAIVLDPELEIWVWSDSPHVDDALGWSGRDPTLRQWLQTMHFMQPGAQKPSQPKEAMEKALRVARKPRSSAIYEQLAMTVSVDRCQDPSFLKLKGALRRWFGETPT
jgi:hypothetical protein